ncbi:MAG: response regulator transcription factor [Verrucomicrobia bacterium]|nr:response regulator transcription factor [Verrucomicrobiota bacterium]
MMITALLVDDEAAARSELRRLLATHGHVQIVAECASVAEARQALAQRTVDLVFLDIQMPSASGFELLPQVPAGVRIVFVTASDRFAVRAFEVNALDYLLKPVEPARLAAALARLGPTGVARRTLPLEIDDSAYVTLESGHLFLRVRDLLAIRAEGDYTRVATRDGRSHFVRQLLGTWEERLPPQHFLRVHRSALVNLRCVRRLEHRILGGSEVWLDHLADPVPVGRRQLTALKAALADACR